MKYIDVHSHIHDKSFDYIRYELINSLEENNIYTITIGTDYESSLAAKKLADQYENIYYTIGVHPCDDAFAEFNKSKFKELINKKCVAIGECGLDYYYLYKENINKIESQDYIKKEKDRQKDLFIKQIDFARENNLPLMLHGRPSAKNEIDNIDGMDAYWDMISMLSPSPLERGAGGEAGNVHFFVGNIEIAKKFIDLGFNFSLGGVITITHEYDEMIKFLPLESIHAETDSPYVVPRDNQGKRVGKINTPLNIEIIINKIAELKNISKENLHEQLLLNSKNLFGI